PVGAPPLSAPAADQAPAIVAAATGDDDGPTRKRRRRGGRGPPGPGRAGGGGGARKRPAVCEPVLDHGDEGYGFWLDGAVRDDPVFAEHWGNVRALTVRIEADQIVIRADARGGRSPRAGSCGVHGWAGDQTRGSTPRTSMRRSVPDGLLHERADLLLLRVGQILDGEVRRPHGTVVEVRLVAEAERRVPRLELGRALEEADDLVVLRIGRHPGRGSGVESRGDVLADGVDPLRLVAIRLRHLGDLGEDVGLAVLARALALPSRLAHRGSLLGRE